jgi:hypothetical protein
MGLGAALGVFFLLDRPRASKVRIVRMVRMVPTAT